MKKKMVSVFSALLIVTSMFGTAFAADNVEGKSKQAGNEGIYQEIREKLSAEYGVKITAATDEQLKQLGVNQVVAQKRVQAVSPADFEAELRATIEQEKILTAEAEANSKAVGISEDGFRPVVQDQSLNAIETVTANKNTTGARASINATLDRGGSTNIWIDLNYAATYTGPSYGFLEPYFVSETYNYRKTDGSRTFSVTFGGYTVDKYYNVIAAATRNVEFYASSY